MTFLGCALPALIVMTHGHLRRSSNESNNNTLHNAGSVTNQDNGTSGEDVLAPALRSTNGVFDFRSFGPATGGTYESSAFEKQWILHRSNNSWMAEPCSKLNDFKLEVETWLEMSANPTELCSPTVLCPAVFSRVRANSSDSPEWIEPLAFLLRHPKATCGTDIFDKNWLVLATKDMPRTTTGQRKFFDAGGGGGKVTRWFLEQYQKRGVVFDEIFVWEISNGSSSTEPDSIENIPEDIPGYMCDPGHMCRSAHLHRGVGVDDDKNSTNNPVALIANECSEADFCVFKLDIDSPKLENSLLQQILDGSAKGKIDEFFFEEHVHGRMQDSWGENVVGEFSDAYEVLQKLRESGIRAHSWV